MISSIEIKAIIIILLVICGFVFIISADSSERIKYNDGICKECGGTLIYQQSIGHRYSTSYIFKCDKCHQLFEFDEVVKYDTIHYEDGTTNKIYTPTDATPNNAIDTTEE